MIRQTSLIHIFILVFLLFIFVGDIDAAKSNRRGGNSGGWGFKSRPTPKSKPQPQYQGGSKPGTIGWNVPSNQKPNSGTGSGTIIPKASAPNEHISKISTTNVRSEYLSSGTGTHSNSPYNPSSGYNPSSSYNPSSGYHQSNGHGSYNPSNGYYQSGGYGGYNPSYGTGHRFSTVPGQGYNPSYGGSHSFNPSYGHSPSFSQQPQTMILQSQSSRPGIGQLAKEAFVFAGVSAGVNSVVNRILPGGIYGHSSVSSSGVVPPVSHTQITYNNYYNNGSETQPGVSVLTPVASPAIPKAAVPVLNTVSAPVSSNSNPSQATSPSNQTNQVQPQQDNLSTSESIVSDAELQKLTESLFAKDTNNAFKHITMKTQVQKTDDSTSDDASENLLDVKSEVYEIPTIKAVIALHDNYEFDVKNKENITLEKRREESDLLDIIISTEVMKETMKFLANKGYVSSDEYEFKDTLKRIWFSQFKRIDGDASSSGFETVFLAEKFDNEIIGLHNWLYFAKQEEAKKLNYLGYIKKLDFGINGAIIKGRSSLNDIVQPITTFFIGTSPELEIALYTICFYVRPNNACSITLGGATVLIITNRVNYFGKDILISAFPDI